MSTNTASKQSQQIFRMSLMSLLAIGYSFSMRSSVAGDFGVIFEGVAPGSSGMMVGEVLGIAFLGYAITIFLISPFIDAFGMGLLMKLASLLICGGTILGAAAPNLAADKGIYWVIWSGMLTIGIGWGIVDAVTNPLLCALYPEDKTHKLNVLHAWWPGGIMIGGLVGLALGQVNMGWQLKLLTGIIPALAFGGMCFFCAFPPTERKAAGISFGDMFRELYRRPLFWCLFGCMFLTAASELAPGQWVDMALTRTVGMRGIWLLIYVSGMMFVLRHFAGPLVKKVSPIGLLWISCLLTAIGLYALSVANSPVTGILAATLWGAGVCYLWPTMLATTSERFPRGGALLLGLMGTAGTLSIKFFLPIMGMVYDKAKVEAAGGEAAFAALPADSEALNTILVSASQQSFRFVTLLPIVLLFAFGFIWFLDRRKASADPSNKIDGTTKHTGATKQQ